MSQLQAVSLVLELTQRSPTASQRRRIKLLTSVDSYTTTATRLRPMEFSPEIGRIKFIRRGRIFCGQPNLFLSGSKFFVGGQISAAEGSNIAIIRCGIPAYFIRLFTGMCPRHYSHGNILVVQFEMMETYTENHYKIASNNENIPEQCNRNNTHLFFVCPIFNNVAIRSSVATGFNANKLARWLSCYIGHDSASVYLVRI